MCQHETEPMVFKGRIKMPYQWTVGETGSRFFAELRDHGRIWGTKCPECEIVFIPPRRTCPRCFCRVLEWVELCKTGTLVAYTIVRQRTLAICSLNIPFNVPFAYGLVRLDGADTCLPHFLGEVDLEEERIVPGMRVEAVLKEKERREGSLFDIQYFKPAHKE